MDRGQGCCSNARTGSHKKALSSLKCGSCQDGETQLWSEGMKNQLLLVVGGCRVWNVEASSPVALQFSIIETWGLLPGTYVAGSTVL